MHPTIGFIGNPKNAVEFHNNMEQGKKTPEDSGGFDSMAKAKRLTVKEVLQTKGFEGFTKEQAERYIDDLERFCILMYQAFQSRKTKAV